MRLRKLACVAAVAVFLVGCASTGDSEFPPAPPRGYGSVRLLKLAYALGLIELVELDPAVPDTIVEYRDIEYLRIGDTSLTLDIYQPVVLTRATPVLVFIHGGSWRGGDKQDYLRYLVDFAQAGYVTVTISYRFAQEAVFPAAVQDLQSAIAWIRDHADEYMMDPDRIALIGGSAGGHLAMMAAYSDDEFISGDGAASRKVQAVVNLYGPSDLTTDFAIDHPTVEGFLGATYSEHPELFVQASPVTYLSSDDPPTLIFHGTLDETVPVDQSDLLKEKLDQNGVESEYHRLEGWPHAMDAAASVNFYCQYYIAEFLAKYLAE